MKHRLLLAGLVGTSLLAGCERQAPGPRECQALAYRLVGVRHEDMLRDPRVKAATDRIVVECLTTPYDRKLVSCVEARRDPAICMLEMRARKKNR